MSEPKSVYIVQGAASQLSELNTPLSDDFLHCWTCPKSVQPGDTMLVYLMAPISAIVAIGEFTSEASTNLMQGTTWDGKPAATFENLRLLKEVDFVTLGRMRLLFPEWQWAKRPQGSVRVPDIYAPFLLDEIEAILESHLAACRKCGGEMKPGQALANGVNESEDFDGDAGQPGTTAASTPAKPPLVNVIKCADCGHSF